MDLQSHPAGHTDWQKTVHMNQMVVGSWMVELAVRVEAAADIPLADCRIPAGHIHPAGSGTRPAAVAVVAAGSMSSGHNLQQTAHRS